MSTTTAILSGIFIWTLYYIYDLWKTYRYWKNKGVVGPTPVPIFGNYKSVILRRETESELLRKMYDDYPNEKYVGCYKGVYPVLMVRDPVMIKDILVKNFDKFQDRCTDETDAFFDKSLFLMKGNKRWQVMRQAMSPAFTKSKLSRMIPALDQCLNKYIQYLQELVVHEKDVEFCSLNNKYLLEVIGTLVFGVELNPFADGGKFERFLNDSFDLQMYASLIHTLSLIFPMIYTVIMPAVRLRLQKMLDTYRTFLTPVIYRKINPEKDMHDFMQFMVDVKEKHKTSDKASVLDIDDDAIIQQSMTYCMASYEVSSSTMSFVFYELALNQDVQRKCYKEITEVLEQHNGELSFDCISDMKYFDMVLNETIRKHSSSQAIDRRCCSKYTFPDTDLTIDKDVLVLCSTDGLQNDPKYHPNPDVFDPERFSPENKASFPQCTYFGFGHGPRNCIGARFAKITMMMAFVRILQKFQLLVSDKTEINLTYDTRKIKIVSPVNGLWVTLKRR